MTFKQILLVGKHQNIQILLQNLT